MPKSKWTLFALSLLFVAGMQAAQSEKPRELLELKRILTPSESHAFDQKPDYRDRMGLFGDVVERLGSQISRQTKSLDYPAIERTLLELQSIAVHGVRQAGEPHTTKDGRSRKVKRLEIQLRRLVEDLEDLKLKVHFELRLVYEEAESGLENFRNEVLSLLFESSERRVQTLPPVGWRAGQAFLPPRPLAEPVQRRRRGGIQGDQFTDEEFEKVQDAQKLLDRVKVFIEIAESRLTEISRRREGTEWKGDKDNPLEFYTVAQMVHAYDRSIEGIMIFIDEKATHRLASEKDIKKALTTLNKKIQEFIPQLEPIRQQAFDEQDEELYNEVRSAMKSSDSALKGSQLGLGAPAQN